MQTVGIICGSIFVGVIAGITIFGLVAERPNVPRIEKYCPESHVYVQGWSFGLDGACIPGMKPLTREVPAK